MLVGIDGNEANVKDRVGIGRYALELLNHLHGIQHKGKEKKLIFQIFLKNAATPDLPKHSAAWQYKIIGPKPFWTQVGLPLSLYRSRRRPDVIFSPTHYGPRFSPIPSVISIMDLSFIHFPEFFNEKDLHQLRHWTNYSVNNAKKILTISEFSKQDIIDVYNIASEKVEVTYPGYDKQKFKIKGSSSELVKLKKKYNISDRYILYLGTLQPRKNILSMLEAYAKLLGEKAIPKELKLVIAGKKGWLYDQIFAEVSNKRLNEQVIFTGYVEDENLPALYRNATCFVLPSLYEGFGLTVIEALACGIPVVVSRTSCLPEIVGDAGLLIDPTKVASIAQGLAKVVGLSRGEKDRMIEKGLKQIQKFDWEICARKTLSILKNVADKYDKR